MHYKEFKREGKHSRLNFISQCSFYRVASQTNNFSLIGIVLEGTSEIVTSLVNWDSCPLLSHLLFAPELNHLLCICLYFLLPNINSSHIFSHVAVQKHAATKASNDTQNSTEQLLSLARSSFPVIPLTGGLCKTWFLPATGHHLARLCRLQMHFQREGEEGWVTGALF